MASGQVTPPLVVIVGPTASGKTSLAVELAKKFDGEVISADSRAIYREVDIGAAKPTLAERKGVQHWGIDLVRPDEQFTAADFQRYAQSKIREIRARDRVPILAGGTGLYVDAVIFGYEFGSKADESRRSALMAMELEELHEYCHNNNISLPDNYKNKQYVVRAIEQNGINHKRSEVVAADNIVVGISTDRELLRARIALRVEHMLHYGVVEEAKILGKKYGWNTPAMTGNIYPLIYSYLKNEFSLQELQQKAATRDWQLAKRQLTWFRRNKNIRWCSYEEAEHYLSNLLARHGSS